MDYMCLAKAIGMVILKGAAYAAMLAVVAWVVITIIEWCEDNDNIVVKVLTWMMYAVRAALVLLVVGLAIAVQYEKICQ